MILLDRPLRWLGQKLQEKGFIPGPDGTGFTDGAWTNVQYDYATLGNAYIVNPWVHACVSRQAEVVSSIPLKVYREKGRGEDVEREEVFDHPLVDLLWNPGRFSGGQQGFMETTVADYRLNGEFFWFVENGSAGQSLLPAEPKELRRFRSQHMKINPDPLDIIKSYTFGMAGSEQSFEPEFIVHGKTYNPNDDYRGLPPLEVAKSSTLLHWYMTRYNQLFFKNGANPGHVMSTDRPMREDEFKTFQRHWEKGHRGIEKSHRTAFLTHGFKPQSTAMSHKDAEFVSLETLTRQEVLAIFMMPHVLVGLSESVNYANAREQVRIFFKYTVTPICRRIQGAINTQLIPVWYGGDQGLFVEFDLSDIEALQADALKKAQENQIYVNAGVKTQNEVRLELNLAPFEGDEYDLPKPSSGGFGGILGSGKPALVRAVIPPTRVDQWKARDRDFIEGERKIERTMRDFFVEQGKRIVRNLEAVGLLAGVAPTMPETADVVSSIRQIDPSEVFMVFDVDKENEEILRVMRPVLEDIIDQAGNGALAAVGSGAQFKLEDPRVQAYLAKKDLILAGINDTTSKIVNGILVDASAEGVSVAETGRRIRDQFSDFSKTRAETIARTEVVGANNAAAMEGYRQSEVVQKKEWLTARDGNVRDSHQIDGEQVGLDQSFSNGLTVPGVDGPPEDVINCRCTVLPVLED
jgi:HK97 family phage portal protein